METIDRVAELMITIEEFSELLNEETAAIRAANAKAVASLLNRKAFLATHYSRQLQALSDRREGLADLDPSVKAMLNKSWQDFGARVAENAATLEVAQRATRQVVDIIVEAIKHTQGTQVGNGYAGAYGSTAGKWAFDGIVVRVDRLEQGFMMRTGKNLPVSGRNTDAKVHVAVLSCWRGSCSVIAATAATGKVEGVSPWRQ